MWHVPLNYVSLFAAVVDEPQRWMDGWMKELLGNNLTLENAANSARRATLLNNPIGLHY